MQIHESWSRELCIQCNDSYHADVPLTSSWALYEVPFNTFRQGGWGRPRGPVGAPDIANLFEIFFTVAQPCVFDVWVDDVGLYRAP